ncbi:MarR family winged helix-turn-helix transcriptional regulator [Algihabitans albus]|uniref:MarR family winged helix-turn-helix transcriptional regulator n=1 Tax=Algihabitans albus TaxID=2164067 RepID=UPI000E5C718D|nr:MarR family transcriptional regulator [Algihabitans albus]
MTMTPISQTLHDVADTSSDAEPLAALQFEGVGSRLREAYRLYMKALQDRLADENVPIGLWYFLCALWQEDGISQRELSRRVGTVEPTAVGVLAQMERREWVVRDRDPDDQRRRVVFLTDKGRDLRDRLKPVFEGVEQPEVLGLSDPELATLCDLLERLSRSVERSRLLRGI